MNLIFGLGHICSELLFEARHGPVNWEQVIYINMEASMGDLGISKDFRSTVKGVPDGYSAGLHKEITEKIIKSLKKLI